MYCNSSRRTYYLVVTKLVGTTMYLLGRKRELIEKADFAQFFLCIYIKQKDTFLVFYNKFKQTLRNKKSAHKFIKKLRKHIWLTLIGAKRYLPYGFV